MESDLFFILSLSMLESLFLFLLFMSVINDGLLLLSCIDDELLLISSFKINSNEKNILILFKIVLILLYITLIWDILKYILLFKPTFFD